MKFKHNDMCWYHDKLDHRGQPYEWPCCGEVSECDSDYVETLKKEIERLQSSLEEITDASAIVLTESLRYQEVLHAIMEAGPASPEDKKHLMAKDALEELTYD